jgi:hypothetical protein
MNKIFNVTHSYIGVRNTDGIVDYIYCHFDGYPEYNGEILAKHYTNDNKINELLKLGDLSILGEFIGHQQNFDDRIRGCCLAYGRDRGDTNTEAKSLPFCELIKNTNVDYVYVWDGDYWECYNINNPEQTINLYTNKYY